MSHFYHVGPCYTVVIMQVTMVCAVCGARWNVVADVEPDESGLLTGFLTAEQTSCPRCDARPGPATSIPRP